MYHIVFRRVKDGGRKFQNGISRHLAATLGITEINDAPLRLRYVLSGTIPISDDGANDLGLCRLLTLRALHWHGRFARGAETKRYRTTTVRGFYTSADPPGGRNTPTSPLNHARVKTTIASK